MRILHVVGGHPGLLRAAPVVRAFEEAGTAEQELVHAGQENDELAGTLFESLDLPRPDLALAVVPSSPAVQTARLLLALDPVVSRSRPDWIVTVGDPDASLAATLVGARLGARVARVDAGVRCGDRSATGEMHRIVADGLADTLFTTERAASENLRKEGVAPERIHFVGNVMIDVLDRCREQAEALRVHQAMGLTAGRYVVATLHRPRNVDRAERLGDLLAGLAAIPAACGCDVVLPLHPRTAACIRRYGLESRLSPIAAVEPLPFLEFLSLVHDAGVVITDSGSVQEETSVLGVPCITLGPSAERPATVSGGTNRLFRGDPADLADVVRDRLQEPHEPRRPEKWDGHAAERIVGVILGVPAAR